MTDQKLSLDHQVALLVVDVQNDFLPGGALAVPQGDEVVPLINHLAKQFPQVVLTQDWHPAGHISFANCHPEHQPFEFIDTFYGKQCLWPEHCVQGGHGAELAAALNIPHARLVIRKGIHKQIDSYSAFLEADRQTTTGLAVWLKAHRINEVAIVGLATDFCVAWTALDAIQAGFTTWVIEDACRGIDVNDSLNQARQRMLAAGVKLITSQQLHQAGED